ncbi:MAG TPA: nucleotidyltransferase domain-containing protein [Longimicrobiaceae bacterium]|nr:nucleotidyltransferase domain-containing protein [Longimicrobiaceae bacterium]
MDTGANWLEPKSGEELRQILAELRRRFGALYGDRLRELYVFGSYARGEARSGSDLDVLVVLDHVESYWEEVQRTSRANADLSLQHDLSISTVFTSEERWRVGASPFLRAVREEGRAA